MTSKPKISPFKGDNSEECTAFIQAIREAAWTEGKLRDPAWMADLASLYFSGRAMTWHAKLPLELRQDWFKLEGALVDRWALAEEDDDSHIQPVPAAAPKLAGGDGNDSVVHGVLKVLPDTDEVPFEPAYITFVSDLCFLTEDRGDALRVRFNSGSKPGLLEWTNGPICSWLAIHWGEAKPLIGRGSKSWASLTIVSSDNLQSSCTDDGPWRLMGCKVSPKSEITPVWRDVENSKENPLCAFVCGGSVFLAVDSEAYTRENPKEKRAKLVLEPID